MKNYLELNSSFLSIDLLQKNQEKSFIKCPKNNKSFNFCVNQNCRQESPFTCWERKCSCQNMHKHCLKADVQVALEDINKKIQKSDSIKITIETIIDKIIDELSNLRQDLLKEVDGDLKYSQLEDVEMKFLNLSKQKSLPIRSRQTALLWKILSNPNTKQFSSFCLLQEHLQRLEKKAFENINQIKMMTKSFSKNLSQSNQSGMPQCKLQIQSSIVNNLQDVDKFFALMPNKIKQMDLMYKASENAFSMEKYYEMCGTMENTLIIVKTQKDKIFGGYTPLQFYTGHEGSATDSKLKSFLFSLSQNQVFTLNNEHKAIHRWSNKQGPNFSGGLSIKNNSHINPDNWVGYLAYYSNPKHGNNAETWRRLNGTSHYQCKIVEWEVFRVQFEE